MTRVLAETNGQENENRSNLKRISSNENDSETDSRSVNGNSINKKRRKEVNQKIGSPIPLNNPAKTVKNNPMQPQKVSSTLKVRYKRVVCM